MGYYMRIRQFVIIAETAAKKVIGKIPSVSLPCCIDRAENIRSCLLADSRQIAGDVLQIKHKSILDEFINYAREYTEQGEKGYKSVVYSVDSPFAKYVEYIENWNKEAVLYNERIKKQPGLKIYRPKKQILSGNWSKSIETKIGDYSRYKNFLFANAEQLGITKDEYMQLVDEVAKLNKEYALKQSGLRKEIADRFDDITRWNEIFHTQCQDWKNINYHRFYNEQEFNAAVDEYIKYVEGLTEKRVLVPCRSRMCLGSSFIGVLNNPKNYQDFDYLLINHGRGSSLITDITHPDTWIFSDNGKSIWEYIESNVEPGKKVLVACCETQGLDKAIKAGVKTPEEIKYISEYMPGIGKEVIDQGMGEAKNPLKICESGVRHIIGHMNSKDFVHIPLRTTCDVEFVPISEKEMIPIYYQFDFSKYKVENLIKN